MKNKFFITGASGFIGANITRALVKKRASVSVLVRQKALNWRLADLASKIDIYQADILNPSLEKIVRKIRPNYIFHLAAYGVRPDESDPLKMVDVNIKGTINLLQAVKKIPFKLLINTGSAVEYGIKKTKMGESHLLEPINDYGVTKAAATLYCQKEAIRNKLPMITFRLFTPFGYYENKDRLVPSVILSAIRNETIRVSSPFSVRDFIFIEDVIDAYRQATQARLTPGEIINIGSSKQQTIENVVKMILKITKSSSKVKWGAVKQQARFIEPKRWEAHPFKSRRVLQWRPAHTMKEGLKKTVAWFKENKKFYVS